MATKKVYMKCGEAEMVITCDDPVDAAATLLDRFYGKDSLLDPEFVYMHEQGYREGKKAKFKVPVEEALAKAGFSQSDFLFGLSVDARPSEWNEDDGDDEEGGNLAGV